MHDAEQGAAPEPVPERERAPGAPSDGRPRPRALAWVIPGALAALAGIQIALALGSGLSPWKGGGFGMFSTTDHGGFRIVRATVERGGAEEALRIPGELDRARRACRDWPTRRCLDGLARRLAPLAWDSDAIRVEVWRTEFGADLAPERVRVASHRVEVPR